MGEKLRNICWSLLLKLHCSSAGLGQKEGLLSRILWITLVCNQSTIVYCWCRGIGRCYGISYPVRIRVNRSKEIDRNYSIATPSHLSRLMFNRIYRSAWSVTIHLHHGPTLLQLSCMCIWPLHPCRQSRMPVTKRMMRPSSDGFDRQYCLYKGLLPPGLVL